LSNSKFYTDVEEIRRNTQANRYGTKDAIEITPVRLGNRTYHRRGRARLGNLTSR